MIAASRGPAGGSSFGAFLLGGMRLALPMEVLREVTPCGALTPLPCARAAVLGGLELRGAIVPVLDLRVLLGQAAPALPSAAVVVIVHEGRVLGLLAEGVAGVFDADVARTQLASRPEAGGFAAPQARPELQARPVLQPHPVLTAAVPAAGAAAPSLHEFSTASLQDCLTLLAATVRRGDSGEMVSVIDPAALMGLPGLPLLADPEPQRQITHAAVSHAMQGEARAAVAQEAGGTPPDSNRAAALADRPILLMRTGRLYFSIDAVAVHSTLSRPRVEATRTLRGPWLGTLEHAGAQVPALDLAALCGLGALSRGEAVQAVLLQAGPALVALLVQNVIDVANVAAGEVVAPPALGLPRRELVGGLLVATALGRIVAGQGAAQGAVPPVTGTCFHLDSAALAGDGELLAMAATHAEMARQLAAASGAEYAHAGATAPPGAANSAPPGAANMALPGAAGAAEPATAQGCEMITYMVGGEMATPLEQIEEVLPWHEGDALAVGEGPLLGVITHRGCSVPIVSLCHMAQCADAEGQAAAPRNVLLVGSSAGPVGFAASGLKAIDRARWQGAMPLREAGGSNPSRPGRLVELGSGAEERMVQVLDLAALAETMVREGVGALSLR
jgi:purine-binding chemotaxis protein CheW